jgi:hypothetical protein
MIHDFTVQHNRRLGRAQHLNAWAFFIPSIVSTLMVSNNSIILTLQYDGGPDHYRIICI